MRWQERVYGPLLERTLENAQLYLLRQRYDLSRDSQLGRAIVAKVNEELDAEEIRRQVRRVRIGELYLRFEEGEVILPIRTQKDIERVVAGDSWRSVRKDILQRCADRFRAAFPSRSEEDVNNLFRVIWSRSKIKRGRHEGSALYGPRRKRPWYGVENDQPNLPVLNAKKNQKRSSIDFEPELFKKLLRFLDTHAGIPPAIQESLLLELSELRERFYPRIGEIDSGQMPLAVMHVDAGRSLWQSTHQQPLAPVSVTVLEESEYKKMSTSPPETYREYLAFNGNRIARVMTEAFVVDGLLTFSELQWILLVSNDTISVTLDYYQRRHHVILPCPGSILDMGSMMTHKDIVIRLHLDGMTVTEIARKTHHSPRSVDAYIKSFEAVLILYLYGFAPSLISRVLGRSDALTHEYLQIIKTRLRKRIDMQKYLLSKGVELPVGVDA